MKKTLLIFVAFLSFSVINVNNVQAQAVQQGKIIIDGYYGWPNLWSGILKSFYVSSLNDAENNIEFSSFGAAGARIEYMFTDNFGFGVDVSFANSVVSWTDSVYNTSTNLYNKESYKVSVPRLRVTPKFNYHFVQSDNIDLYGVFGIGYNGTKFQFETSDTNWNPGSAKNPSNISFRLAAGARFFITDNIGFNVEAGIGSALLTGGISAKF